MPRQNQETTAGEILGCERTSQGIVITFADHESFLFDIDFLYRSRVFHGRHVPVSDDESDAAISAPKPAGPH